MNGRLSKRAVLRIGYAAVLAVLVFAAVEAYRIQSSVSEQSVEIYRHYVDQDAAVATLRRNLWFANTYVRDFFIESDPGACRGLRCQIKALIREDDAALDHLEKISTNHKVVADIRRSLAEFRDVIQPLPRTMLNEPNDRQYAFLQREIVPRRADLYGTLLSMQAGDQQRLQESEKQFAATRRDAANRLLTILGLCVLLAVVVARASLRHAENGERQAERQHAAVEQAKAELQQLSARLLEDRGRGPAHALARTARRDRADAGACCRSRSPTRRACCPAQPEARASGCGAARELAEAAVQTVRDISLLLRPPLLDDLGLVPALQFQLEEFLRRSGITCEFVEEGVSEQLPDAVKTCVYRVVQEALHNCEKHSGRGGVRVTVRQLADCLVAEIEDNGRGFALNEQGMPSRCAGSGCWACASAWRWRGGSLTVDSAPGHGTRIGLRIPARIASKRR